MAVPSIKQLHQKIIKNGPCSGYITPLDSGTVKCENLDYFEPAQATYEKFWKFILTPKRANMKSCSLCGQVWPVVCNSDTDFRWDTTVYTVTLSSKSFGRLYNQLSKIIIN